jgi:phospholipase A-2-activating protein
VLTKGKKDGQVVMVKNGESVEAHQWSSTTESWTKIGDVVQAVPEPQKKIYEGVEYDYVFDVDIQEGAPPLKLPYNVTQNPYEAAQKFLERNGLEMGYIDQVVKFIEQNTGGVQLGVGGGAVDPYCFCFWNKANCSDVEICSWDGIFLSTSSIVFVRSVW